ncbi:MAG: type VI secretion system tube protein TssD [Bacteroidetes bacterium]|nr:type VI secretion system tube protein TssD [Bacteroidota bacterium]
MTFKAELKFNDSKFIYNVLECDYDFTQQIDITGKPSAKPRGGIVNVVVESKSDPELMEWMVALSNVRSGEITFFKDDAPGVKLKTLSFKEAFCIRFQEKYTSTGPNPMIASFSFTAKEVTVDGVTYSSQWTNQ